MPSPVTAIGSLADTRVVVERPAPARTGGGFQRALAAALDERVVTPPSRAVAPGVAPAVPLARMLAVLSASAGSSPTAQLSTGLGGPTGMPAATSGTNSAAPSSGTNFAAPSSGATEVVDVASRYLGVPYRWGGTDPATGLDCSGLVQRAFADLGVSVPRTSAEQARVGTPVALLAEARPGDLLFWASTRPGQSNHIGIYVGDGKMLHAPYTGEVVKIAPVRTPPPDTIRRIALG